MVSHLSIPVMSTITLKAILNFVVFVQVEIIIVITVWRSGKFTTSGFHLMGVIVCIEISTSVGLPMFTLKVPTLQ